MLPMSRVDELTALIQRYKTEDGVQAKQTLERILDQPNAARRIFGLLFGPEQRAALRTLTDLCRRKNIREDIAPMVVREVDRLIAIPDDKARKTAYALIGLCAPDACADKLLLALKNEKTRFVRPSIILALGNSKAPEKYLNGYIVEPGEPKHVAEEQEALKKALGKAAAPQKIERLQLPPWSAVTYIKQSALLAELESLGLEHRSSVPEGTLDVRTAGLKKLRCYEQALYDLGATGEYEKAAKVLDAMGCNGVRYRIEAGGLPAEQRRNAIRSVSEGLARFGYEDNPSAYAFELRLVGNRMAAVFPGDTRFSYRKQTIPASINPVTAASVMRICRPYMKSNARVLDPFCGSGTMLIERGLIAKTQSLVGVDISSSAIRAACENRRASGQKIALIHGDALQFGASKYDEVVSNMPFGIRVSKHTDNERLYAVFAVRLAKLLEDDGYAFLFTLEKKLLRDSVRKVSELRIVYEEIFESGGLSPSLYIIKKERNI